MRYFEDLTVGETGTFGEATLSEAEILAFAEKWDPQRFHVDPDAAAESVHGGLIASGLHTIGVAMRHWVDEWLSEVANLGARYIQRVEFHEPVRPGDTLLVRGELLAKTTPDHTEAHGYADYELAAHVDGDPAMTMVTDLVVRRRGES
ncbi:MaoC/PaaZ C-terminal domain-containing protein [Halorientalis regularis]|jgi:acyl dehydratase|uniref:MaoC like domain-containing protein n=1 Tax=Halorientalis regularis TaxID=660518 RepID=A0A1G7TGA3_9EURY|nr:MaoC/PaaZ C-terminal domain-containing protein [Halorientalis regularis]SDG34333.1 MaoC like domain-containing protein [Halorientalis regularis]